MVFFEVHKESQYTYPRVKVEVESIVKLKTIQVKSECLISLLFTDQTLQYFKEKYPNKKVRASKKEMAQTHPKIIVSRF